LNFDCPRCGNNLKLICPDDWPVDAINEYRKCQYCGEEMDITEKETHDE